MRVTKGFWEPFKANDTVGGLLKAKAWESGHAAGRKANPDYAYGMEVLIERELSPDTKKNARSTLEKELKRLAREDAEAQIGLFPIEDVAKRAFEEKVAKLERHWPDGLWEENGEPVTVALALSSPELRKKALNMFYKRAANLKSAWKFANWELAVFSDLIAQIENQPAPTEDELNAYYGAEWNAARAVTLHLDGLYCVDCGNVEGPFEVDHIVPVKTCWSLRNVPSNHQVFCIPCHKEKHRQNERPETSNVSRETFAEAIS